MTGVIRAQLTGLARAVAHLMERVRVAVAGDPGRAVGGAVERVVQAAAVVVAAGVSVVRWWVARQGTWPTAAGLGLGVGLPGALGGPGARTAVAVLAATADLLAGTDALGAGAARLGHL